MTASATPATSSEAPPSLAPPTGPGEARRRRPLGRLILWPIGLAVLGLLVVIGVRLAQGDRSLGEVKLKPYRAPDFSLMQFNGERFSLGDQRGKVVVVNFWASWCIPCKTEAPILESAWQRYHSQGVEFVGVDIKDTPEDARTFLQRYTITYPNGFDEKKQVYIDYGVYGLPETFIVDRQGFVSHHVIGATTQAQLDSWLIPMLGNQDPKP